MERLASSLLLFWGYVGIASAQNFTGMPACAIPCLDQDIPQIGCSLTDTACQCLPEKQYALTSIIASCLTNDCSQPDLIQAQEAAAAICGSYVTTNTSSTEITNVGLSTADRAGIAVALVVTALAAVALAVCLWKHRRARRRVGPQIPELVNDSQSAKLQELCFELGTAKPATILPSVEPQTGTTEQDATMAELKPVISTSSKAPNLSEKMPLELNIQELATTSVKRVLGLHELSPTSELPGCGLATPPASSPVAESSAHELQQLEREERNLEKRGQILLELKRVEERQADVRERIKTIKKGHGSG